MITIQGIKVDVDALLSIKYRCDPSICSGICCASYHVNVEEHEIDRIIPVFPEISKFAKHLKKDDTFKNVFVEDEDEEISLETNDKWECQLAWKNEKGELLCSLHSLAIKNNTSYYDIKPKPCCLWPLALTNGKPRILTIQHENFPCIINEKQKELDPEIGSIIKNIFGIEFLDELTSKIE